MLEVMRRDDFPPPSSRSARRVGYRFATIASLVRQERMSVREAEGLADEWMMFVRAQQRSGVDPAETASMLGELARRRQSSRPRSSRDPARRKRARPSETVLERARRGFHRMTEEEVRDMAEAMSRPIKRPAPSRSRKVGRDPDPGRQILNRPGAGQNRISERGFPYRVCRYGLQRHALLFPLARYTMAEAKRWAREHGAPIYQVEQKANFIHIRLNKKELFVPNSFRNIELLPFKRDGVRVLVACPRLAPVRGARARGPGTRRAPARRRAA